MDYVRYKTVASVKQSLMNSITAQCTVYHVWLPSLDMAEEVRPDMWRRLLRRKARNFRSWIRRATTPPRCPTFTEQLLHTRKSAFLRSRPAALNFSLTACAYAVAVELLSFVPFSSTTAASLDSERSVLSAMPLRLPTTPRGSPASLTRQIAIERSRPLQSCLQMKRNKPKQIRK
jgi:hypothetical protein